MSNEKIIKVIMDGNLPKTCGSCYHIVVRPKGRRVFWECYFVEGSIESRDMVRPEWCPLEEYCEICEGYGVVVHAYEGIAPCPECQKENEDK